MTIRNTNTRHSYVRQVGQFLDWREARAIYDLKAIHPLMVTAYIEEHLAQPQNVVQALASIRKLFD